VNTHASIPAAMSGAAVAVDRLHEAVGQLRSQALDQPSARGWGVLGRLEDDAVAGHERGEHRTVQARDREVPRRDDPHDPARDRVDVGALARKADRVERDAASRRRCADDLGPPVYVVERAERLVEEALDVDLAHLALRELDRLAPPPQHLLRSALEYGDPGVERLSGPVLLDVAAASHRARDRFSQRRLDPRLDVRRGLPVRVRPVLVGVKLRHRPRLL
jgi:hypothetical protein